MPTNAAQLVLLMQIGDVFYLMLELGRATQKYLDNMTAQLNEMGVKTEQASELHNVIKDSDTQVL
jgi:hypothetical protein